jgi:carotenoid cleavage dioxygenase-like enzyme
MALQESERFEMDSKSFDGSGRFMTTDGKFTAHPKMDLKAGEMVWFGYSAGPPANLGDYGAPADFHRNWVAAQAV